MKFTDNPCADLEAPPKMCTMAVGGTRLHISGTKEEIQYVMKTIKYYEDNNSVRRSAILNK